MALALNGAVQNLQFLHLAVQFIRNLRRNLPQNINVARHFLQILRNIIDVGANWLNFVVLILRYLKRQKQKKKGL